MERKPVEVKVFDGPFNKQPLKLPVPIEIQPFDRRGLQVRLKEDVWFPHHIKAGLVMPVHHVSQPFDLPMCHKHDGSDPRDWDIRCEVPASIFPEKEKTSGFWKGTTHVLLHFRYDQLEIIEGAPLADMSRYDNKPEGPLRVYEEIGPGVFNTRGVAVTDINEGTK